jgi:hypothetical protein
MTSRFYSTASLYCRGVLGVWYFDAVGWEAASGMGRGSIMDPSVKSGKNLLEKIGRA